MYDKLKNIQITNETEPRITFSVEKVTNADGVITKNIKDYDICLSLIWIAAQNKNAEKALESLLTEIYQYAKENEV